MKYAFFRKQPTVKIDIGTLKEAIKALIDKEQQSDEIFWEKAPHILGFHPYNDEGNLDYGRIQKQVIDLTYDSTIGVFINLLKYNIGNEQGESGWKILKSISQELYQVATGLDLSKDINKVKENFLSKVVGGGDGKI